MTRGKGARTDYSKVRIILVMIFFGLALTLLWVRTGWVQLHDAEWLQERAARQNLAAEYESGARGRILDRNGGVLATSAEARSVYINAKKAYPERRKVASTLSAILSMPYAEVLKKAKSGKEFIWLKRQISDREAEAIAKVDLPGVHLRKSFTRVYPNGTLAGQLLGFVNIDGKGLEGVERQYDARMIPGKAKFVVNRDAKGRRLYLDADGREVDVNGLDVRLTIDAAVQQAAESTLARAVHENKAAAGILLVVKVDSGEILGLANYPLFNPNISRRTKAAHRRNRAAMDVYEPGSTMKPLLVAAALEEGVVKPDTLVDCENGKWRVATKTIRDTHPEKWLTVSQVIRYSSNIGVAKIARDLGSDVYHSYLTRMGFGEATGLRIPAERSGSVIPAQKWTSVDQAAISFGQGIGVTALQLAQAFLIIGDGGTTRPLKLVMEPKGDEPHAPERIFSKDTCDKVLAMMREVVEMDGTGRVARIPGITVAGKTGTAQKASPEGGYGDKRLASFVGLFPGENPEYLIIALVDEPETSVYGSKVAAPAVRDVAIATLAYYGKLPDKDAAQASLADISGALHGNATVSDVAFAPPPMQLVGSRVPDIKGLPLRRGLELLLKKGIVPTLNGEGTVITKQKPAPGSEWPDPEKLKDGKSFVLWLS